MANSPSKTIGIVILLGVIAAFAYFLMQQDTVAPEGSENSSSSVSSQNTESSSNSSEEGSLGGTVGGNVGGTIGGDQ